MALTVARKELSQGTKLSRSMAHHPSPIKIYNKFNILKHPIPHLFGHRNCCDEKDPKRIGLTRKYPSWRLPMAQKRSVLIVDDELSVRESLCMILKPKYEVHTAADGREALECIEKDKIDVVTLDLKMPGLSGIDVLQEIKKKYADIEVVVITAYGTPQNLRDARRYGAAGIITKPFNAPDLINSVSRSIERRNYNLRLKNLKRYNSLVHRY